MSFFWTTAVAEGFVLLLLWGVLDSLWWSSKTTLWAHSSFILCYFVHSQPHSDLSNMAQFPIHPGMTGESLTTQESFATWHCHGLNGPHEVQRCGTTASAALCARVAARWNTNEQWQKGAKRWLFRVDLCGMTSYPVLYFIEIIWGLLRIIWGL